MKHKLIFHSLFFILGFTLVFSIAGILIETAFSTAGIQAKQTLSYIGGAVILIFGLYLTGILRLAFLEKERRFTARKTRYAYLTSFIFGAAFGAGWSPCIGAILGAILTLAAVSPTSAFLLLLAYSLGIGVPFLLAAVFASHLKNTMKNMQRWMKPIQVGFGVLLVLMGLLILSNNLVRISELTLATDLFIGIDAALASKGIGFGVAFIAGLASFLSPCVFPLLPAYLAYLGGLSVKKQ